jgi:hypothetical protein
MPPPLVSAITRSMDDRPGPPPTTLTSRPSKKPFSTAVGLPIDSLWRNHASKTVTFVLVWPSAIERPASTTTSARPTSVQDFTMGLSSTFVSGRLGRGPC